MGIATRRSHRAGYEPADEYSADAYRVKRWPAVAVSVLGWETEPDEDTWWSGCEVRTGKLLVVMIGDDARHAVDPDDVEEIKRSSYCGGCGQIGCHCDGYSDE